jgi:hypothetical protein
MPKFQNQGFQGTDRSIAIEHHLQYNHYPPLPLSLVPVAEEAIDAVSDGDFQREIALPKGLNYRGAETTTAIDAVEAMHLDDFIDTDDVEFVENKELPEPLQEMRKPTIPLLESDGSATASFIQSIAEFMSEMGMDDIFEPVNSFTVGDASDAIGSTPILSEATKAEKETEPVVGKLTSGNTKLKGMQAFSLPARVSCPSGCLLSKNPLSTCAGCFGADGQYNMNSKLKNKLAQNMAKIEEALKSEVGQNLWIAAMTRLISAKGKSGGYFRVHDVGDFFRDDYFPMWIAVANALPEWKFWVPTKQFMLAKKYQNLIPENFILRVSTPIVDDPPIRLGGVSLPTATVHFAEHPYGFVCPAPEQGGKCGSCRACWDRSVLNVSYPLHGAGASRYANAKGKALGLPPRTKGKYKGESEPLTYGKVLSPEERERRRGMATGEGIHESKERLTKAREFADSDTQINYDKMPEPAKAAWDVFADVAASEGYDVDNDGVTGKTMDGLSPRAKSLYQAYYKAIGEWADR